MESGSQGQEQKQRDQFGGSNPKRREKGWWIRAEWEGRVEMEIKRDFRDKANRACRSHAREMLVAWVRIIRKWLGGQ